MHLCSNGNLGWRREEKLRNLDAGDLGLVNQVDLVDNDQVCGRHLLTRFIHNLQAVGAWPGWG